MQTRKIAITVKRPCKPECLYELTGEVYTTTETYILEVSNIPEVVLKAIDEEQNEGCVVDISFVKEV